MLPSVDDSGYSCLINHYNIFIINNEKKAVMLYDIFGNVSKIFWAGEEVLGFCIAINKIFILSIKGFVIYGT